MRTKLLLFFSAAIVLLMQPATGYSAFATRANALPHGHHSCHSHYHYHPHHNDRFITDFFKTRNKQWTDWGAFFDYLCIGPAGTVCGIVGMTKREYGATVVMVIGAIETAVEVACLSR